MDQALVCPSAYNVHSNLSKRYVWLMDNKVSAKYNDLWSGYWLKDETND